MKKWIASILALALAAGLAACGKTPETSTPTPTSEPDSTTSAITSTPGDGIVEPAPLPGLSVGTPLGDYARAYPKDMQDSMTYQPLSTATLTDTEMAMIVELVQDVVFGYQDGDLPLAQGAETEGRLNNALPADAELPLAVTWDSLTVQDFDDMWQLQVGLPLGDNSVMPIMYVYLNNSYDEETGFVMYVMYVVDVQFGILIME